MEMKKYKLGEIADIIVGYPFESAKFNTDGNGVLLVRGMNVSERFLRFGDEARYWDYITDDLKPYYLKENDIVIGMDGSKVGKNFALVKKENLPLLLVQRVACVRAKKDYDQRYIWQYVSSKRFIEYVNTIKTGSSIPHISGNQIANFPIFVPDSKAQKKIADVFSSLDDKIALNRRMNEKLEQMAKRLYDRWFVQFDFPNADGKPYKASGGKMVWNETLKREIPEGWEIKRLREILSKIDSGKRPSGGIDKTLKTGIPSLGAECIDSLGNFDFAATPFVDEKHRKIMTSGKIESNDILIYKDGAYVGKTTLFRDEFPYKVAFVNEHVFLIHAEREFFEEYIYFTLCNKTYFQIMQNLGKAKAAQPGLNREDLQNIIIIVPNKDVLKDFHEKIDPLFARIFSNSKCIGKLIALRDRLLPLLMNGQVEVK